MANRLADASSPYLRQHADNPVDWWQWGDDAFAEAKRRDCPVLISIGYAACHWCHVMAHESFENPDIAAIMNESFVNIKVDREERPDIDAVYMEATQAMTGSGGWPMTVVATPDGQPFFCGTYFPARGRNGQAGFGEICGALAAAWEDSRDKVLTQAAAVVEHLRSTSFTPAELPTIADFDNAVANLVALYEPRWGGFGGAPKFPQPMAIDVLLGAFVRHADDAALKVAVDTLDAMAAGGIYDHLGGGFARYSTDAKWLVPHFEKMLSDQALLVRAYTHAFQLVGLDRHRQVIAETIAYVLRDLRLEGGGFASSEDADADGVEGSFQVWTPDEIRSVLVDDPEAAEAATRWWSVTEGGNFEGTSILHRLEHRTDLIRPDAVERARAALFTAREQRVRPGLDDKVLAEWNALMVGALAEASVALGEPDWLTAAERCATFLLEHLRDDAGWHRSWHPEGGAGPRAVAVDLAGLCDAFTRLYEATGTDRWLDEARACAEVLLADYADEASGGFFTTAHDAETLVARQKDVQDSPTPSANSAAAVALARLGAIVTEERYLDAARGVTALTGRFAGQHPTAFAHLLAAITLLDSGTTEVTISGTGPVTDDLLTAYRATWRPDVVVRYAPDADPGAMVCRNQVCDLPTTDPTVLSASLGD
ncbi:MAG: thioredoxin domain-containing protein [Actinobacteria bacterium]|nr:thioredoxin domain-containing protein [Actinomycetota bacterium]